MRRSDAWPLGVASPGWFLTGWWGDLWSIHLYDNDPNFPLSWAFPWGISTLGSWSKEVFEQHFRADLDVFREYWLWFWRILSPRQFLNNYWIYCPPSGLWSQHIPTFLGTCQGEILDDAAALCRVRCAQNARFPKETIRQGILQVSFWWIGGVEWHLTNKNGDEDSYGKSP